MKVEKIVGRILSSSYRKRILEVLVKKSRTPKKISELSKINFSHISIVLRELENLKLIKCITPHLRKGKMYMITKLGKKVLKQVKNNNKKS